MKTYKVKNRTSRRARKLGSFRELAKATFAATLADIEAGKEIVMSEMQFQQNLLGGEYVWKETIENKVVNGITYGCRVLTRVYPEEYIYENSVTVRVTRIKNMVFLNPGAAYNTFLKGTRRGGLFHV